jgi:Mrp family chromosome partitioning ATPase
MRFLPGKRAGIDTARLHEHDAVRDVVARLLAARDALSGEAGAPGARRGKDSPAPGVVFLFTSLRDGQGTSTLAAAVARGLAESGRATLLAVVEDPAAAGEKALPGSVTLREFVEGARRPPQEPPLLTVRVPARVTDFPDSAQDLRAWLDGFQVLILDAAPVTESLTRYWVPRVEGVVLVADGEQIGVKSLVQARQDLERLGGRLVGVVLNRYEPRIPRWMAPYFVYG